jgi:hypothetical protein
MAKVEGYIFRTHLSELNILGIKGREYGQRN